MKKLLSLLILPAVILSFAACSSAEESSSSSEVSALASETSESEVSASESPEPTEEPETEFSENTNPLTGLPTLSDEAIDTRPIAVTVNNSESNLPQYGIADADIIFEFPVEGNMTRLMAMYADYTVVPDICSIRSARYYMPMVSEGFDAVYIHWGINPTLAAATVAELGMDNIDGNYGGNIFARDQDKLNSGYALEHTGMLIGEQLPSYLENNGYDMQIDEDKTDFFFNFNQTAVVPDGDAMTSFTVDFHGYFSDFTYDEENAVYLKTHNGNPHMDSNTNTQLAFTNVIVLETPVGVADASADLKSIDVTGTNKSGSYVSQGVLQSITWTKESATDTLKLFDEDGNELFINPGKTYISFGS